MNIKVLDDLLERKKMTQRELADAINVAPNTITALKKGDFKISTLEKIAKVLDVPIIFFFDDTPNLDKMKLINAGENNVINLNSSVNENESLRFENKILKERIKELQKDNERLWDLVNKKK